MTAITKSYTNDGAKQTLLFKPNSMAGSFRTFEDIIVGVTVSDDVAAQRVSVYGIPSNDYSQLL